MDNWEAVFDANGGYDGLNTALNAAGGEFSRLKAGGTYWTRVLAPNGAWFMDGTKSGSSSKSELRYVRACLAF